MTNEVKKDVLLNLANIFDNAADNGLLLLNYPMCEAYRDCCIPNIEDYRNKFIGINDSINYKKIVHERNTCMDINKYKKDQFTFIQACNIKKTNHVCTDHYSFGNYDNFLTCCSQHNILEHVFKQIVNIVNYFKAIKYI